MTFDSLDDIFDNSGAESANNETFMRIVGDLVTGSMPVDDLENRLASELGLGENANVIANQILSFIGFTKASITTTEGRALHQDIVEAEAALAHVSTIRTMARDMEDLKSQAPHETTAYQSTQPTLERSSVPKNTTPPSPPRWGSS